MRYHNPFLAIDGVEVSEFVEWLDFEEDQESVQVRAMGQDGPRSVPGLRYWSMTVAFRSLEPDLDNKLFSSLGLGLQLDWICERDEQLSDMNPRYSGLGIVSVPNIVLGRPTVSFTPGGGLQEATS